MHRDPTPTTVPAQPRAHSGKPRAERRAALVRTVREFSERTLALQNRMVARALGLCE